MTTTTVTTDYFQVQLYSSSTATELLAQTKLLVPLGDMAEIITVQRREICPLPGVPRGVAGVLNLRGQLIWVTDLRMVQPRQQGTQQQSLNPQEKVTIVLIQSDQGQIGCLVATLQGITTGVPSELLTVTPKLKAYYPFGLGQLALADGTMGIVLDTAALIRYLQSV